MTCKHFRFLIPKEDADDLREHDNVYCLICDNTHVYGFLHHSLIFFKENSVNLRTTLPSESNG